MKQKNPLYLVKGKTVHPTQNIWEYVVEKFNLRPVINILLQIIHLILEQVRDYPSFIFAKNFIASVVEKFQVLRSSTSGS